MTPASDRTVERFNAWLTLALLFGIVVVGNLLARSHMVVRRDLSEDQLYTISDAARGVLAGLEDELQVKAYFTEKIHSGEFAIAKARLEGLLEELETVSGGKLRVDRVDPNGSSRVLLEAQDYGMTPYPVQSRQGTLEITEQVYLGLLLRYRGREDVVPLVFPGSLESVLVARIYRLQRERGSVVGWFGPVLDPDGPEAEYGCFGEVRALLSRDHDVRRVEDLESGVPVPDDVDVLLVVRPKEVHPRSAFEIDQFVQRGGRGVLLVDLMEMSFARGEGRLIPRTGLERLLEAWGAPVTPEHVWDAGSHAAIPVRARGLDALENIPYPPFVRLREAGFNGELSPTANLQDGVLCWAQPIAPVASPEGIERSFLVRSSDDAYRVDMIERIVVDAELIESRTDQLFALGKGRSYDLGVSLAGRFPSPFADGAPEPWDPVAESAGTTDEEVLSAASESQVVVFGDADWVRDKLLGPNRPLIQNVVDWLSLDEQLVALRSRIPRSRPLADFLNEERTRLGLDSVSTETIGQAERRMNLESDARRRATRRQWSAMLWPLLGTLTLLFGAGLGWAWSQRAARRPGA